MTLESRLRSLVEEQWQLLHAEHATDERRLRVADLSVGTADGAVAVAVDHEGHRHLLIPMQPNRRVRRGVDGPALLLRKQPLEDSDYYGVYADLTCLVQDLDDLFTELCVDVLQAIEPGTEDAVRALHRVLDRWRSLFRSDGTILGPDQAAGLFGELTVLNRLLERDPGAHRLWLGPEGHRHDFSNSAVAVEVKAGLHADRRRARIHGLEQLDPPQDGRLSLVWIGLLRTDGPGSDGLTLVAKVRRALELCDDERALRDKLSGVGYWQADEARYEGVHFTVVEERWYSVDDDFPGLTSGRLARVGLPITVQAVDYTVDLSGTFPVPMADEETTELIDAILRESE